MRDYKVKYRTFDQLLDSVMDEFSTYDKNSLIEPSHLIKIAKKINKQINHRVTKTKQCIVEYDNYNAKLPNDLLTINFLLYIKPYQKVNPNIQGTQRENVTIEAEDLDLLAPTKEIYITDNGDMYDIVEKKSFIRYHYKVISKVEILKHSDFFKANNADVNAELIGEFVKLNMSSGFLYINYEGMLEDDDGNLLVVDHDLVNDYYEYSFKRRILENLFLNGEEASIQNKIQLIEARWRESRKEALSVANMFDFGEIEETLAINRKAAFQRYYSMFI